MTWRRYRRTVGGPTWAAFVLWVLHRVEAPLHRRLNGYKRGDQQR